LGAKKTEPAVADGHVTDLVAQDDVQDGGSRTVAMADELPADAGGGVQSARLHKPGHQGHAR